MANEEKILTDPLGNRVQLSRDLCDLDGKHVSPDIYDDVSDVIEKPAFIIEMQLGPVIEHHYFRSIGWHHTLLLTARKTNDEWKVSQCTNNPATEKLSHLLKNGKKIF